MPIGLDNMSHHLPNKLINETSPYLLQHAYNPVEWYAWGDEALQKAKKLNRPILVSIGYSACHWCHVMEKESFENEAVAKIMNEHFINIKIDREERPDLDAIYMDAVQAISGSGGWPLNVFLTPETKPFYGGTYYPPVKAFNRTSWTDVLQSIITAWHERKNEIESQADNLLAYLQKNSDAVQLPNSIAIGNDIFSPEQCHTIFKNIIANADKQWGGFGKAPKFPQTFTIQYLLQYYHFTNNEEALQQAILSIDKMLQGGIYDHIAGGLARYSTDAEWLAPHFEKMLYDNALLLNILCDVYQVTHDENYSRAIHHIIAFVKNELMHPDGGFYAALDADSEGEEGKYYVWQKNEVEKILGDDAEIFCAFFDVSENGNWEHKNILRILIPAEEFVKKINLNKNEFDKTIQTCLLKLDAVRKTRVKPGLDDKIILSWNALMLHAIAKASAVLQNKTYHDLAIVNFNFIITHFNQPEDNIALYHTCKNGQAKYPAFLEDYAYFIQACITLYETTFDKKYIDVAKNYANYVIENFSDEENNLFYFTHYQQKDIIIRKKEMYDGAMPSANAIMAKNLLLLSIFNETTAWQSRAEQMVKSISTISIKYPTSFGNWSVLILQLVTGINEIGISGIKIEQSKQLILSAYIPNKILYYKNEDQIAENQVKKSKSKNLTFIYLCKKNVCLTPANNAEEVINNIQKERFINRKNTIFSL